MSEIQRESGSFRDPASFVFYHEGRVFRCVDEATWSCLNDMTKAGLLSRMIEGGLVVATEGSAGGDLPSDIQSILPPGTRCLRHRKIQQISYPYEWSFSMLADAALLHLDIQRMLIEKGLALKDASAFNVLFEGCQPVFIDLGSIERPARSDIWFAYGQFCRMFLYPLLAKLHRGMDFRQVFMGSLDGLQVEQAYRMLGFWKSFAPGSFLDVFMQNLFAGKKVGQATQVGQSLRVEGKTDPAVQLVNLNRLQRKIEGLKKSFRVGSMWSEYGDIRNYSDQAIDEKKRVVREILNQYRPRSVLDVGCNTGEFSFMAAEAGASVMAVDYDHDAVEALYRTAKRKKMNILPLVADLSNPSPGLGLFCEERQPLLNRVGGEMVFALALIHHLMVTACMPLEAISRLFAQLTETWLVLEYIDPQDGMFRELLAIRKDYFSGFSIEKLEAGLSDHFGVVSRHPLPGGLRTLLVLKKK